MTLSLSDFNNLPTYGRKFIINRIIEDNTPKGT